jgi:50S ribosomal subunit-associated GTPase HflX
MKFGYKRSSLLCYFVLFLWLQPHWSFLQNRFQDSLLFRVKQNQLLVRNSEKNEKTENFPTEKMFSLSYDLLEYPTAKTRERDLEDLLRKQAMRFSNRKLLHLYEKCYLVGIDDMSLRTTNTHTQYNFTYEESLTELSELAGAAGLRVVGTTYQRLSNPGASELFLGSGKVKEILRFCSQWKHHQHQLEQQQQHQKQQPSLSSIHNGIQCIIIDAELTPSQQKNLELAFNTPTRTTTSSTSSRNKSGKKSGSRKKSGSSSSSNNNNNNNNRIKVMDRTALILHLFAQHAQSKAGQWQVQYAYLTYQLPRLSKFWTHLERQGNVAGPGGGGSGGGVGSVRGPGETQLEYDQRQVTKQRQHLSRLLQQLSMQRQRQRNHRRQSNPALTRGAPVIALVGYTNAGKSSLLNLLTLLSTNTMSGTATNASESSTSNSEGKIRKEVFVADMLFATLDPTTRLIRLPAMSHTSSTRSSVSNSASYSAAHSHTSDREEEEEERMGGEIAIEDTDNNSSPHYSTSTTNTATSTTKPHKHMLSFFLTDTVGFIQRLPESLLTAFQATLEELQEADLLIHVLDISHPHWQKQDAAVVSTLTRLGLDHKPRITLWNKADLLSSSTTTSSSSRSSWQQPCLEDYEQLAQEQSTPTHLFSTTTGYGLTELSSTLTQILTSPDMMTSMQVLLESTVCQDWISWIYDTGMVQAIYHVTSSGSSLADDNTMIVDDEPMKCFTYISAKVPHYVYEQLVDASLLHQEDILFENDKTLLKENIPLPNIFIIEEGAVEEISFVTIPTAEDLLKKLSDEWRHYARPFIQYRMDDLASVSALEEAVVDMTRSTTSGLLPQSFIYKQRRRKTSKKSQLNKKKTIGDNNSGDISYNKKENGDDDNDDNDDEYIDEEDNEDEDSFWNDQVLAEMEAKVYLEEEQEEVVAIAYSEDDTDNDEEDAEYDEDDNDQDEDNDDDDVEYITRLLEDEEDPSSDPSKIQAKTTADNDEEDDDDDEIDWRALAKGRHIAQQRYQRYRQRMRLQTKLFPSSSTSS